MAATTSPALSGNAPRPLLGERDRACCGGTGRAPRRTAFGCSRGRCARPLSAAAARPRPPLAQHPGRARAHPRPSRTGRGCRRSHGLDRYRTGARASPRRRLPRPGDTGAGRARGGDVQPGRRLGYEPDGRRAPAACVSRHPISRSWRSASDCTCPCTRSRPRRPRSTASAVLPHAAGRSSAPSKSGSWRAPSTRRAASPEGHGPAVGPRASFRVAGSVPLTYRAE
jgi:hypothetical protein